MSATTAAPLALAHSAGNVQGRSRLAGPGGRRFLGALAAVATVTVAFVVQQSLKLGGGTTTTAVDDIGTSLTALLAAGACGYAASKQEGRLRIAWLLIAASGLSWSLGNSYWTVLEVGLNQPVPFPSAADIGYLGAIPTAIAGILAFPSAPGRSATRGKAIVDALIVALSLVFITWALGIKQVYDTSSNQPLSKLLGATYPAADAVIIAVLLLVMRRATAQQRGSMVLLMLGFTANAVADSAFAYLTADGEYGVTGSVLDAGWFVGYLLIAIAPLWPAPFGKSAGTEGPVDYWQMAVPWVSLLGASVVAAGYVLNGRPLDLILTLLAAILGVLLVISSVLSHRDFAVLLAVATRSEAQLAQRTEILNQVITHAPLGVARVGIDLRILEANPRLGTLLHAPAKVMVGALVGDFLSPDALQNLIERSKPLWEGEVDNIEGDTATRRADGSEIWLHYVVAAVRKQSGRIDYFLAMFEDITSKHDAQETTMANLAALERLNKLKSEFVSMVSHEFRTALVGIQGFSELLQAGDNSRQDVMNLATDINNDAQRLNRMIGEMLDLDRMEAGKIRLHLRPLDLNALISDTIDRLQAATDRHRIAGDLDLALPAVSGDADRLVQVVSNLLSNAVKYSPDGGDILVRTQADDGNVHVSVIDHGIGIAPEFVGRLFGRYERFESNRTSKVGGTGLGLAITRQIIELHGGKIWVESKPGEGSNFQFTIPLPRKGTSA